MTRELEPVFVELGLSQYLDAFVDQGFDTWETILDIQESDLDALGVKLGHRRKLQRRIANARGGAPGTLLASPLKLTHDDSQDAPRNEPSYADSPGEGSVNGSSGPAHHGANHTNNGVTKRKYRRHPKSDENAPERPPSAYVLFSNKMREDLKSQNLTFTEIAKLVGENWQSLAPAEKEAYESQANSAKERYHKQLAEYKKTPEYRRYAQYLHDFKDRQAKHAQGHDAIKRHKGEAPARLRHGSSSSSSTPSGPTFSNGSRSGSGSEPPPTRQERVNSASSVAESVTYRHSVDEARPQHLAKFEHASSDNGRNGDMTPQSLPPLSDMFEDRKMRLPVAASSAEGNPYGSGFVAANRRPLSDGPSVLPRLSHQPSSNGSVTSASSIGSYGRPSTDSSLPIHSLLSGRPSMGHGMLEQGPPPILTNVAVSADHSRSPYGSATGIRGYGFEAAPSAFHNMRMHHSSDGDVVMTSDDNSRSGPLEGTRMGFDGMTALLKAGEIVGQHGN